MTRDPRRRSLSRTLLSAATVVLLLAGSAPPARCWDSRTHQLITRLAIPALPAGPLKTTFEHDRAQLEEYSVEPDSVLRPMYGQAEARRHYIDLEYFGDDPFANLQPDFAAMEQRFGVALLDRSGTLPWAIETEADATESALHAGDCAAMLRHAGYLAHYIGDASQPLHTTKYYDGITRADRGMHARLESTVDHYVGEIEPAAAAQVHLQPITAVWTPVIDELQQSHALVERVMSADRTAVEEAGRRRGAYENALMEQERDMIVRQVADAASVLASVWAFEDAQAGHPAACAQTNPSTL